MRRIPTYYPADAAIAPVRPGRGSVEDSRQRTMRTTVDRSRRAPTNGIAARRIRRLTFSDITDGLSNTIAVFESGGRPFVYRQGRQVGADLNVHRRQWWRLGSSGERHSALGFECHGQSVGGCVIAGVFINRTNGYDARSGDLQLEPLAIRRLGAPKARSQPYSFHPGGLNVLIGDGAVKFLDETINIGIVAALVTRNRRRRRGLERRRHHLPRRVQGTAGRGRKGAVAQ